MSIWGKTRKVHIGRPISKMRIRIRLLVRSGSDLLEEKGETCTIEHFRRKNARDIIVGLIPDTETFENADPQHCAMHLLFTVAMERMDVHWNLTNLFTR